MATDTMIPELRTRRGFLGLVGRTGIVVVGAGAALAATEQSAWAGNAACCTLAYPPGDPKYCKINSNGYYICPSPGHWETWCCCSGCGTPYVRTYKCAECTTGSDCHHGTYVCSAYWTVNPNGCSSGCPCKSDKPRADAADLARWNAHPWGGPLTEAEKRAAAQAELKPMDTNPYTWQCKE